MDIRRIHPPSGSRTRSLRERAYVKVRECGIVCVRARAREVSSAWSGARIRLYNAAPRSRRRAYLALSLSLSLSLASSLSFFSPDLARRVNEESARAVRRSNFCAAERGRRIKRRQVRSSPRSINDRSYREIGNINSRRIDL